MLQRLFKVPWPLAGQQCAEKTISAETISTPEKLAHAIRQDAFILHFDVDWAMQAIQSRFVVVQFREAIESDSQYRDVMFRRLDFTGQKGPLWDATEKWLKEQGADQSLMFSGYGAIAWVKSGKVVDAVHYAAQEGLDQLMAKTRSVMTAHTQ